MKVKIENLKGLRLLNPGPLVLITSKYQGKSNIVTAAWTSPVSHSPPLVSISLSTKKLSHILIGNSKEFTVNIPSIELLDKVLQCGSESGRNINKFKQFKLKEVKGKKVSCPSIKECFAFLECKVVDSILCGDHYVFIGEIVNCEIEKEYYSDCLDIEKVKFINHLGGSYFTYPEKIVERKRE
ncbi:MAG: Flavin reductase like domain protein [Candidatus Methanofastidiosum methylothiophilum]|uniref:Flavin reductase like domain protein n=1 Tax=Candidatus Methanofastidiosum methylothiophilum TaxID=1705564 RepID=A0A150IKZ8_9EURY|nr:MAG: Flavin reductase like domain protein [Candidatus Methanofastidiosum methylthiophilus]KYC47961.1 MAG: Flavin reductase like domain protein [Candidatus Methanofastidiosum methylthiophilus]KYC50579.1 MAG: Flavin reductase like domain protein [Candidatus Methanofastidiosum methylthiophilus]